MRHGSLFSGFGAPDLAADWLGWENVFQCEWEEFPTRVLEKNFPDVDRYKDIRDFNAKKYEGTVDIISGGFPCQPFSQAGKRKGESDDRYLWPEMLRIIREVKPRWIVGENVAGILSMDNGKTLEGILASLETEGYKPEIYSIPACAVGAPHRRDRVWIVAHADGFRSREVRSYIEDGPGRRQSDDIGSVCSNATQGDVTDTDNARADIELRADRKRSKEDEGREGQPQSESRSVSGNVADTESIGTGRIRNKGSEKGARRSDVVPGIEPRIQDEEGNDTNADEKRLRSEATVGEMGRRQRPTRSFESGEHWRSFPTQPPVCSGNDGFSGRMDGLTWSKWRTESVKGYGNAIVPQVIYEIFRAIELYEYDLIYGKL